MGDEELAVVDVRITDAGKVPPRFYLHPDVQDALRAVVRSEVVLNDKKCPPGTEPIYGPVKGTTAAQAVKVRVAGNDFVRALLKEWRVLVLIYITVVLAAVTIWIVGGFNG